MDKVKIMVPTTVDPEELWFATFGSGFESWHWWLRVEFLDGSDWDKPGRCGLAIMNPDDEDDAVTYIVDMDRLLWAVEKTLTTSVDACTGAPIRVILGEVDFDACVGDCILQTAVLGEVVYG